MNRDEHSDLDELPAVLTADEVARLFRQSRETVRRKTAEGIFRRIDGFHALLYRREDILTLLGLRKNNDKEPPNG